MKNVLIEWRMLPARWKPHTLEQDKKWGSYFTEKRSHRPIKFTRSEARHRIRVLCQTVAFVKPQGLPKFRLFEFRLNPKRDTLSA